MRRPSRWAWSGALAAVVLAGLPALVTAGALDRLDRFRELAATRLGLAQTGAVDGPDAYRETYGLLDEEVVENLASGGVFASPAFLQDRLDAFAEVWGGATLRVVRMGPLVLGVFHLGDAPGGNAVHVYGPLDGEPALLTILAREGRPAVHRVAPAPDGAARFVVAWEGAPSGRGTYGLRLDLAHQRADTVRIVWTTADVFPDGLYVRSYGVRGDQITVRYELRYPGWTPGCEGQTEAEEVFRLSPGGDGFARVSRREHNAWHRELHASVTRLVDALGAGDRTALAGLVVDRDLVHRLPAGLQAEPACDAPDGANPERVSVAARGEGEPWQLTFRRTGARWRLSSASPVIP
jgi:hypothetical protein